jgi:hypothetical protein
VLLPLLLVQGEEQVGGSVTRLIFERGWPFDIAADAYALLFLALTFLSSCVQ